MNNRTVIIALMGALGMILIVFFFVSGDDDDVRYQWYETYRTDSEQPYGTAFIFRLLKSYRPDGEFITNRRKSLRHLLDSAEHKDTDYVLIGHNIHLNSGDEDALVNFISSGNDVFIATRRPPESLIARINQYECDKSLFYNTDFRFQCKMNFYHDTLKTRPGYTYAYRDGSEDVPYYWNVINEDIFCDSSRTIAALGYLDPNEPNFVRIQYGRGFLYLHSNPIVFTNYFLTQPEKMDYASGVFSHLRGKNIIWDEFSKLPFINQNEQKHSSPLSYVLQQPSLKYAWWLMLITVILYVIFAAKRRQRVMAVLEKKTNTSLEYIKLIATLHFQNGNHLDMARKKMKYFLYFIRSKYGIHAPAFKDEDMAKLAEKSKVGLSDVQSIFSQYHLIERSGFANIEPTRLLNLYFAINNFYKHCK